MENLCRAGLLTTPSRSLAISIARLSRGKTPTRTASKWASPSCCGFEWIRRSCTSWSLSRCPLLPLPVLRERVGVRVLGAQRTGPHPDPLPEYRERELETLNHPFNLVAARDLVHRRRHAVVRGRRRGVRRRRGSLPRRRRLRGSRLHDARRGVRRLRRRAP